MATLATPANLPTLATLANLATLAKNYRILLTIPSFVIVVNIITSEVIFQHFHLKCQMIQN